MFFMLSGIIIGIILGVLVVKFVPHNLLGWVVIGLGLLAFAFILPVFIAILNHSGTTFLSIVSIPLSIGCVISGIGTLRKNHHTWQVWLGLGFGIIPLLFWIAFVIGELLYPH
jgi:hypothetical protein